MNHLKFVLPEDTGLLQTWPSPLLRPGLPQHTSFYSWFISWQYTTVPDGYRKWRSKETHFWRMYLWNKAYLAFFFFLLVRNLFHWCNFSLVHPISLYFVTVETSPLQWKTFSVLTFFKQKTELPFVLWEGAHRDLSDEGGLWKRLGLMWLWKVHHTQNGVSEEVPETKPK